jgi:hypothetical protein
MNELYIDILRSPTRSKFRRVLGTLYILIGVAWLVIRIALKEPVTNRITVSFFDFIYTVFFGFTGIMFVIDGSGISISKWFGEAYIKINMVRICIRKNIFSKEWVLVWNEIEQVEISVIRINFRLTDHSFRELNYDHLAYEHIQEIKQYIKVIAAEKDIRVISPG